MKPVFSLALLAAGLISLPGNVLRPAVAVQKKPEAKKIEPRVIMAIPLGVAPGATTRVTLRGLNLEKVKELKFTEAGVKVKIVSQGKAGVPDKNPEKVGDTQIVVDVTLPPSQKSAVSFVVVTEQGDTKPHQLLVDVS